MPICTRRDDHAQVSDTLSIHLPMRSFNLLAVALSFAACDGPYGINRTADIERIPPVEGVLPIIRGTPGVDSVRYVLEDSVEAHEIIHTYSYYGRNGVRGLIQFVQSRNRTQFIHYWRQLGTPMSREQVEATIPLMRAIELRIETEAGLEGLARRVVQNCTRVDC